MIRELIFSISLLSTLPAWGVGFTQLPLDVLAQIGSSNPASFSQTCKRFHSASKLTPFPNTLRLISALEKRLDLIARKKAEPFKLYELTEILNETLDQIRYLERHPSNAGQVVIAGLDSLGQKAAAELLKLIQKPKSSEEFRALGTQLRWSRPGIGRFFSREATKQIFEINKSMRAYFGGRIWPFQFSLDLDEDQKLECLAAAVQDNWEPLFDGPSFSSFERELFLKKFNLNQSLNEYLISGVHSVHLHSQEIDYLLDTLDTIEGTRNSLLPFLVYQYHLSPSQLERILQIGIRDQDFGVLSAIYLYAKEALPAQNLNLILNKFETLELETFIQLGLGSGSRFEAEAKLIFQQAQTTLNWNKIAAILFSKTQFFYDVQTINKFLEGKGVLTRRNPEDVGVIVRTDINLARALVRKMKDEVKPTLNQDYRAYSFFLTPFLVIENSFPHSDLYPWANTQSDEASSRKRKNSEETSHVIDQVVTKDQKTDDPIEER